MVQSLLARILLSYRNSMVSCSLSSTTWTFQKQRIRPYRQEINRHGSLIAFQTLRAVTYTA